MVREPQPGWKTIQVTWIHQDLNDQQEEKKKEKK